MKIISISKIFSLIVAIGVLIPIAIIFLSLFKIDLPIWNHLKEFVLLELVINTFKLVLGVSIGSLLIGISLAYIHTYYDFYGKKFFTFIALMPMGIPAYIMAFVYVALFDSTGIWSLKIKEFFNLNYFLPSIRNFYGITLVLSLSFYPYIYLMARNSFLNLGPKAIEASAMLGLSRFQTFKKVIIPLSLPWIFSGLLLTLMETLGDFGAVSIFNYSTFTTAIYRSWFGLFSLNSAEQLATILISFIFILMFINYNINKNKNFTSIGKSSLVPKTIKPTLFIQVLLILYLSLISLFAFFIPLIKIIEWSINSIATDFDQHYYNYLKNSFEIGIITVIVTLFIAFIMGYATRKYPGKSTNLIMNISSLGYAVPGTVLAVGIFVFFNFVEVSIFKGNKILTSTILAMVLGLVIRFLSVGLAPITNAFLKITESHFSVLELNQNSKIKNLKIAIFPMVRTSVLTAALMVFVEVIKEMPIGLMTRPFGKETLAIRIFELTSEGEWERAALPSLCLIIICLISTFILYFNTERNKGQHE